MEESLRRAESRPIDQDRKSIEAARQRELRFDSGDVRLNDL
jgi:hypothetical protein